MLKLATKIQGNCATCSTVIDAGDWFDSDARTHAECRTMTQPEPSEFQLTSGLLFGDAERAIVENAKETIGVSHISFDGATVLGIDRPRLSAQLERVFRLMSDGRYRTLAQIAMATGCLETSASARLRDLRKTRFGGHTVISRQVEGSPGTYEYRLILRERNESHDQRNVA